MSKTITEQIEDLENENKHLKELQNSFEKMVKSWYGTDAKAIRKMLENHGHSSSNFEKKIASYFGLKTNQDLVDFIAIFCTKKTLDYFNKSRAKVNEVDDE